MLTKELMSYRFNEELKRWQFNHKIKTPYGANASMPLQFKLSHPVYYCPLCHESHDDRCPQSRNVFQSSYEAAICLLTTALWESRVIVQVLPPEWPDAITEINPIDDDEE